MQRETCTIYVALLNEGTPCWRPVDAAALGDGDFKIMGVVPDGEEWEFQPGDVVRCESHDFDDVSGLLAVQVKTSLDIKIASVPDRGRVVAELWFQDEQFAELNQEQDEIMVELYARSSGTPWIIPYSDLLFALREAKNDLSREPLHDRQSLP